MQLGLVTYMWGADWDLPTLIKKAEALVDRGQAILSPENETAVHSLLESAASAMRTSPATGTTPWPSCGL